MARHRSDPRGGARIAIAVSGVVVVLALLAAGTYALFGALDTEPGTAGTSSASASSSSAQSSAPVLMIAVTGRQCDVFVGTPGNADILVNRTLQHGETFIADQPRLDVVVSDAGAVDIRINGVRRPPGRSGQRLSFRVNSGDRPPT